MVARQQMDLRRLASGEGAHGVQVAPVGDEGEPGLLLPILTQQLEAERGLLQWRDTAGAQIRFVRVGIRAPGAGTPDAREGWFGRQVYAPLPLSAQALTVDQDTMDLDPLG